MAKRAINDRPDIRELNRKMDQAKIKIFMKKDSGFFGSLLCSLTFMWTDDVPKAATDGIYMYWNPDWFKSLPMETVLSVMRHEIDHVAKLHMLRRGDRLPRQWNYACDYRINNDLKKDGFTFQGTHPLLNEELDRMGLYAEEDIYDYLMANKIDLSLGSWGDGSRDLEEPEGESTTVTEEMKGRILANVAGALHAAKVVGEEGPGDTKTLMDKFLNPVIDWRQTLMQFFTDMLEQDYSMARPNRRYQDVYLPSLIDEDDGRLGSLLYFQDVSGSITQHDSLRFNSELKYVWEELRPQKVTIAQFDTEISKVDVFENEDRFDWIETVGGGGTYLGPVRDMILEQKPQAAIIFSDLECAPMDCTGIDCPIIWVTIRNKGAQVEKGKIIHIK